MFIYNVNNNNNYNEYINNIKCAVHILYLFHIYSYMYRNMFASILLYLLTDYINLLMNI